MDSDIENMLESFVRVSITFYFDLGTLSLFSKIFTFFAVCKMRASRQRRKNSRFHFRKIGRDEKFPFAYMITVLEGHVPAETI